MDDASHEPVSRLELEMLSLGTIDPDRRRELERLAETDEELKSRLLDVREGIDDAAADLPRLVLPEETVPWWRTSMAPLLMMMAAAAALLVSVGMPDAAPGGDAPAVTFRGALDLSVHRVRLGDAVEQGSLVEAREGDRIQFEVTAPGNGYVSVWDVQDDGQVQAWMDAQIARAGEPATGAVLLDDYEGSEKVFFVFSPEPVELADVRKAVRSVGPELIVTVQRLPGVEGSQRAITITKERR